MRFSRSTAVTRQDERRWAANIGDQWDIGGHANGGYLLAIAARSMVEAVGRPDPVTVTAHYLRPGKPSPITIDVDTLRAGATFSTAGARMNAGDRPILAVLGTFADLSSYRSGPHRVDSPPPQLPPVEDCIPLVPRDGGPPFSGQVDMRLHPDDSGFARGDPSGEARMRGYFRLRDDEPIDTLGLLLAVDAFPPTVFNAQLPVAWVPTVELTAHVRSRPSPGWLRCEFTTRFVTGGFLEEDGEVWDADDRLVAQSRQLALVPRG